MYFTNPNWARQESNTVIVTLRYRSTLTVFKRKVGTEVIRFQQYNRTCPAVHWGLGSRGLLVGGGDAGRGCLTAA